MDDDIKINKGRIYKEGNREPLQISTCHVIQAQGQRNGESSKPEEIRNKCLEEVAYVRKKKTIKGKKITWRQQIKICRRRKPNETAKSKKFSALIQLPFSYCTLFFSLFLFLIVHFFSLSIN